VKENSVHHLLVLRDLERGKKDQVESDVGDPANLLPAISPSKPKLFPNFSTNSGVCTCHPVRWAANFEVYTAPVVGKM
jgi:hypothetical protein